MSQVAIYSHQFVRNRCLLMQDLLDHDRHFVQPADIKKFEIYVVHNLRDMRTLGARGDRHILTLTTAYEFHLHFIPRIHVFHVAGQPTHGAGRISQGQIADLYNDIACLHTCRFGATAGRNPYDFNAVICRMITKQYAEHSPLAALTMPVLLGVQLLDALGRIVELTAGFFDAALEVAGCATFFGLGRDRLDHQAEQARHHESGDHSVHYILLLSLNISGARSLRTATMLCKTSTRLRHNARRAPPSICGSS